MIDDTEVERGGVIGVDLLLVGFGHVGRRFAELVAELAAPLAHDARIGCRIVAIATRRHGMLWRPDGLDARDTLTSLGRDDRLVPPAGIEVPPDAVALIRAASAASLRRERTPVVVETSTLDVRAGQPAIEHVRTALEAGAHVVSANKGPVAFAYHELQALAGRAGRCFFFESAVMDGVPVFALARDSMPLVRILGFRGVLNATTNHILSAMEQGRDFGAALAEMQQAGIAEADASLDVDGWDAAVKTAALANVLMDARIVPAAIARTGIGHLAAVDLEAARRRGRRLRLVASASRVGAEVQAAVAPAELEADDPLAGLTGMANALVLETDLLGRVAVTELDGGLTATAYGLVGDLASIGRRLTARREAPAGRTP